MGKREYRAAAALTVGVMAAAQAQDGVPERIEQVQVTATRAANAVDVQQVPAAITVLKPESLAKYGLGNLTDIASLVPAMSVQEQGPGINKSPCAVWSCAASCHPRCRMHRWSPCISTICR